MIYTCTTNPSLDYYITFENQLKHNASNRSLMEMYEAGGKGVNISIVLNNFQIPSVCLGFLGGFTKDFYLTFISNYPNIQPLFTTIKDNTRINVKVMDAENETSLNAKGPHITSEEFEKFKKRTNSIYTGDYFVLSGMVQDEIDKDIVSLIHELAKDDVKIVLDTDKNIIDNCMDIKPYLIKINDNYIPNSTTDEVIKVGKEMINNGAQNVLFSAAKKDSILLTGDKIYKCANIENNLVNTTGSSDSMVAGFLYSVLRGSNSLEAFKYANAASVATSLTNDPDSKRMIEERYINIEVSEI